MRMNEEIAKLLRQAYDKLRDLNENTNDMDAYFHGVEEVTGFVAEALDLADGGGTNGNAL